MASARSCQEVLPATNSPPSSASASRPAVQAILELDQVNYAYSRLDPLLLEQFDFAVEPENIVVLLGPSGCGKSTLLHLAAGLLRPQSGIVRFGGAPLHSVNTRVSYMTQTDTLLPWRTVSKNIELPLQIQGVSRSDREAAVAQAMDRFRLTAAAKKFPNQLSGGMKRRALLARSLVVSPRMILMDEPFAALDAQMRQLLQSELRQTVHDLRQTVLFVTHDVSEALLIGDHILTVGGRPLRIVDDVRVPFAAVRDLTDLRLSSEFSTLERHLWESLQRATTVDDGPYEVAEP